MKSLFTKIRQFGSSSKKSVAPDSAGLSDTEDDSRSHPFPRVAQSRNDSHVEVSQSVYGRTVGSVPVKFIVNDILGKGHYGMVFLAQEEMTGKLFAVKVMKKEVRNINKYAHIEEAVLRLSRGCPFIIHMFSSFQTTNSFYLVMEYADGGNLKQVIDEYGCMTIPSVRFLAAELVMALQFLHQNGVIHRDLKIQNILMTVSRHTRLIDFGLSRMDIYDGDTTNSGCGTPFYMAPEILRRIPYSHEVDWWALGVVTYKVLTGSFPFMGKTNPEVFVAVTRDSVYYDPHLPPDLVSLFKGLLKKNPSKRLGYGNEGWRHIETHPFFKNLDWVALSEQRITPPPYDHIPEEGDDDSALLVANPSSKHQPPRRLTGSTSDVAVGEMKKKKSGVSVDRPPSQSLPAKTSSALIVKEVPSCHAVTTVNLSLTDNKPHPVSEEERRVRDAELQAHYPFIHNDPKLSRDGPPKEFVLLH